MKERTPVSAYELLSCPSIKQIVYVNPVEHIPNVKVTHVQAIFVLVNISAVTDPNLTKR